MAVKILITNDDGIRSPALPELVRFARRLGAVTVVAPKTEQSGRSQAIDFFHPVEIKEVDLFPGAAAYAMASTPADCVRFGTVGLGVEYDLLISGVNCGYNLGEDIVYSGTIGAIFEGARSGTPGMAISAEAHTFLESLAHLEAIFNAFREKDLFAHNLLYNVNIPPMVRGMRITRQGGIFYSDRFIKRGEDLYIQEGEPTGVRTDDLSVDIDAVREGYISITPLTHHRTAMDAFEKMRGIFE